MPRLKRLPALLGLWVVLPSLGLALVQQSGAGSTSDPHRSMSMGEMQAGVDEDSLQQGIALTRHGQFAEAIPLLRKADAEGTAGYAGAFNLALCYVAIGNYQEGILQLVTLRQSGHETAMVENLLAQAYLGQHDLVSAWTAIVAATRLTPKDERLYAFLLDACADHYEYQLGLRVASLGTAALPMSQRLHYERAVFLARLDRLPEATPEFAQVVTLGKETYLGHLADVQQRLYGNDLPGALQAARAAVADGRREHEMLSLLGTVLMYTGAAPGQPQFLEAKQALEGALTQQPNDSTSQIALGKLLLMEGAWREAILHLEIGRRLEPQNAAIYPSLASAYRQEGDKAEAQRCMQVLARLLHEKSTVTEKASNSPE